MDYEKRELNKLLKVYNIIDDFNKMNYLKDRQADELKDVILTNLKVIFENNNYHVGLNYNTQKFKLYKIQSN